MYILYIYTYTIQWIFTHINTRVYAFVIIIGLERRRQFDVYIYPPRVHLPLPRGISRVRRPQGGCISGGQGCWVYRVIQSWGGAGGWSSIIIYIYTQGAGTWGSPPNPRGPHTPRHTLRTPLLYTPPPFRQSPFP